MILSKNPLKVLGFDFGEKRIGVAVGQSVTNTASPLGIIKVEKPSTLDWPAIEQFIATQGQGIEINKKFIDVIVVGKPLNMDDTEQPITQEAAKFAQQLRTRYPELEVIMVDERLTSKAVEWEVADKKNLKYIDDYSACLIVETYLTSLQTKK